jgi:hypothetical protein
VEELTLANRGLTDQLTAKSSEVEQLKASLGVKDAEKTVAVGERDRQLQEAIQARTTLETENAQLKALALQVEVANELGRPELLKLASRLPAMTDKEALKTVMKDFASFADEAVQARERQLLSGVTPGIGASPAAPAAPATREAWLERINSLGIGTVEREKALGEYGDWLERQHIPQR